MLPLLAFACASGFADPSREYGPPVAETAEYSTTIHQPTTLGVVDTPLTDIHGAPIGVACATCHGPTATEPWAGREGPPFHTGVKLEHGALNCDSCHTADRTALHLADGSDLPLAEAMTLCAQCHGPQTRDYNHGSHGGMTGYWDTRRGPRTRNHCVDCHAPHSPAYGQYSPAFAPNDRAPLRHDAPSHPTETAP